MSLISKLQKYQKRIYFKKNASVFDSTYETQMGKLMSFDEPKSLIERSLFQYKCQMERVPLLLRLSQNIISIFMLLYYLLKPYKNNFIGHESNHQNKAVFLREGITTDMIPNSLKSEFETIYECPLRGLMYLDIEDKKIIIEKFIQYWYLPFFTLKCVVKMAIYSSVIHNYKPTAIITHNEYSFTSSLLTEFCRYHEIEHINVMHGEKLFDIHSSFVEFDRYYVWDQYYADLMISLRAKDEQFKIAMPRGVELEINIYPEFEKEITYYLGGETKNDLINLRISLLNTKIPLEKICLRYHPRYGEKKQILSIFKGFQIEDPIDVPLSESLSKTKYVVSLFSAVLYQSFVSGKEIVIDDISNQKKYKKLQNLKFKMINVPHLLLSELIQEN